MFLRTQALVAVRALVEKILANMVDATPAAVFDITSKVKLYKSGGVPGFNSLVADFTECDFDGYAAVTLASVLGPINLPNGAGMHQQCDFLQGSGTSTLQDALGVYITDSAGTTLLAAEQFATPVPFGVAGDALSYDLILAPKSIWGGENAA